MQQLLESGCFWGIFDFSDFMLSWRCAVLSYAVLIVLMAMLMLVFPAGCLATRAPLTSSNRTEAVWEAASLTASSCSAVTTPHLCHQQHGRPTSSSRMVRVLPGQMMLCWRQLMHAPHQHQYPAQLLALMPQAASSSSRKQLQWIQTLTPCTTA